MPQTFVNVISLLYFTRYKWFCRWLLNSMTLRFLRSVLSVISVTFSQQRMKSLSLESRADATAYPSS